MDDDTAFPARLSLPERPGSPPPLDPAARSYTFATVSGGSATPGEAAALEGWRSSCRREGIPFDEVTGAVGDLAALVAAKRVGWRLAITGDERDVLELRAAALRAGMLAEEVVVFAATHERVRVFCASCGTTAEAASSERSPGCSGCGRTLHRHDHSSRERGAYLGVASESDAP